MFFKTVFASIKFKNCNMMKCYIVIFFLTKIYNTTFQMTIYPRDIIWYLVSYYAQELWKFMPSKHASLMINIPKPL